VTSIPAGSEAIRVSRIGEKARRRLAASPRTPTVVAQLSRSLYLDVAGELLWLGPPGSVLHSRAIIAERVPEVEARAHLRVSFDLRSARTWAPPPVPRSGAENMATASRGLLDALGGVGRPEGFGALLIGDRPAFPLDRATDDARAFLAACAAAATPAAAEIAERLLGLGPGLTPAGDDLVGGAFFACRALVEAGAVDGAPWRAAAETIRARAATRTPRISAVLLGDLLDGDAYAPLHDLAIALARGDAPSALDAAGRLVRIGHSSGWDLLAGFLGALGELPGR